MNSAAGIQIESLTKTYKSRRGGGLFELLPGSGDVQINALDGLSLSINPGEAFGVIGPNGAGKTTLMSCLLGFVFPNGGSVKIDGLAPNTMGVRRRIGYLPERLNFDRWMTGYQFLEFHHALAELPANTRRQDIEALLSRVELEPKAWGVNLSKYSRGMLQRLGLAQAMVGKPKYLLLDEPASGIDPGGVLSLRRLLAELKKDGMTIILNSHQLDQVEKVCDRVAFVRAGKVEALENLQTTGDEQRVLLLRFAPADGGIAEADLEALAAQPGITLLGKGADFARFDVATNLDAKSLLKRVIEKELPLVEATREQGRLERFFLETRNDQ
jgi:ABC-2 type transport system ATP-binding protein